MKGQSLVFGVDLDDYLNCLIRIRRSPQCRSQTNGNTEDTNCYYMHVTRNLEQEIYTKNTFKRKITLVPCAVYKDQMILLFIVVEHVTKFHSMICKKTSKMLLFREFKFLYLTRVDCGLFFSA